MTNTTKYQPRGLYFEEFEIGKTVVTSGRTVTETDVVNFAALSGDYNQIHTDVEFTQSTPFGQRIAHGLLVLSIASGLIAQSGLIEGTVIAFRELSWKFTKPVFFGDTVHVTAEVTGLKPLPRLGGGVVILQVSVINQREEVTARGEWHALMTGKPAY